MIIRDIQASGVETSAEIARTLQARGVNPAARAELLGPLQVMVDRQHQASAGAGVVDAAKMTPAQIAEAQKLAREWKPK